MSSVITPEFRVSYPNVFNPRMNDLNGKEEYSLVALFPKGADLSGLKKLVEDAAAKKWGADKTKWPKNMKLPFRDQSEREKEGKLPMGYEAGAIFLNLKSTKRPGVVDQNVQPIIEENEFYPGCWARASVSAYAYDQKGNKGVSFGLRNVQKTKDGEALGGASRPEDDFVAVANATTKSSADLFD